jgi:germination protein M
VRGRLALSLVALPLVLAACGSSGGSRSTATPTEPLPAPPPPSTATEASPLPAPVQIYFLRDGKVAATRRDVPQTQPIAAAAVRAVLEGPTGEERKAGLTTALPADAELKSFSVAGGLAKVKLGTMDLRAALGERALAQLVYTLTQFAAIRSVELSADKTTAHQAESGTVVPVVKRSDLERLAPAILVESPVVGDSVTSPLHVSGTANTFEATFTLELRTGGRLLDKRTVTATSGSGTRGTFETEIPFKVSEETRADLVAYELSAKDGKPTNRVSVPIGLLP